MFSPTTILYATTMNTAVPHPIEFYVNCSGLVHHYIVWGRY